MNGDVVDDVDGDMVDGDEADGDGVDGDWVGGDGVGGDPPDQQGMVATIRGLIASLDADIEIVGRRWGVGDHRIRHGTERYGARGAVAPARHPVWLS